MIWNEGDICEKLLGYILVIFVVTYVNFPCFISYLIFLGSGLHF